MFFTIEPMVNAGRPEVKVLDDGWTAVTRDRSLSAQFEHMVGVTETGVRDLYPVPGRPTSRPTGPDRTLGMASVAPKFGWMMGAVGADGGRTRRCTGR